MYLSPRNCPWTCCRVVVLLFLKPVGIEGFSHSWKKWLKWNWNGTWERLQEVWALKIGSIEPQVCWGCVGGRGLVVAGDYVIEQGWSCCELASKFGVWGFGATALRFRDCPTRTPVHTKGRMIGKKRGTTLDFTMKVIIFVCTLVNVYNMKKKIELIVTVVSITTLYF